MHTVCRKLVFHCKAVNLVNYILAHVALQHRKRVWSKDHARKRIMYKKKA